MASLRMQDEQEIILTKRFLSHFETHSIECKELASFADHAVAAKPVQTWSTKAEKCIEQTNECCLCGVVIQNGNQLFNSLCMI